MRIADVRVLGRNLPVTLVEVVSDDGPVGIGVTGSPSHVIRPIVEEGAGSLRALLIGQDPLEPPRLWRKMSLEWGAQRGRAGEGGLGVNAMAAIDMALWDLSGKAQGRPLHSLLGGAIKPRVQVYASATAFDTSYRNDDLSWPRKSADQLVAEAKRYAELGFGAMKFGWGIHFDDDADEKLEAIRDAIGYDVKLALDVGCPAYWTPGWTAKEAIRACRLLEDHEIYFVEEALFPQDVAGFEELSAAVDLYIASGESLTTVHEFKPFIDRAALDIVQPDAAQMGVTQFVQVAHRAAEAGLLVVPHGPWSPLTISAHLHILATIPNGPLVEYVATASEGRPFNEVMEITHRQLVEHPLEVLHGHVVPSDRPGLGLGNFNPDAIARLESLAASK